jgi:hypothetical protein
MSEDERMRHPLMTRREFWTALALAASLALGTLVASALGFGLEPGLPMTPDQQFQLEKMRIEATRAQAWVTNIPVILGAVGLLLISLYNAWKTNHMSRKQDELTDHVNGMLEQKAIADKAAGATEDRARSDQAAAVLAERTRADLAVAVERARADAARVTSAPLPESTDPLAPPTPPTVTER